MYVSKGLFCKKNKHQMRDFNYNVKIKNELNYEMIKTTVMLFFSTCYFGFRSQKTVLLFCIALTQTIHHVCYGTDSISIERMIDYADRIEATDRDSALLLYNQALIKSKAIDNTKLKARSYMNLGYYMLNEGNLDSCLVLFNQAKPLYHSIPDTIGLLKIYYAFSRYYSLIGKYQESIKHNYMALAYANAIEAVEREIFILESIGVSLSRYRDYQEAIKIYKNALAKAEAIQDTYSIASIKYNIAEPYMKIDSHDIAKSLLVDAEKISEEKGFAHIYGLTLSSLAEHFYNHDNLESAFQKIEKLDELLDNYEFNDLKMRRELLKSAYYMTKSEFETSLHHGSQALELLSSFQLTNYELKIYKVISDAYKGLGSFDEAIHYLEKHIELKDSIVFTERHTELKNIQIQYETAQKDMELKDQQITIQNQIHTRQFMQGGISFFALLGVGIFILLNQRLKKNKIIALREADIQSQQIHQLKKEKQILAMSSMIQGQESERKRIAQDLHDGLGGLLASIKVKFEIIQKEIAVLESMNVYQQTSTMIDDACSEVRKIAHNMMPDSLTKLGLIEAVRDIAEYTTDINIKVINLGISSLSETQEIMLYRVIQEFVNNSRKHANASQIIIQFSLDKTHSTIYLEDNGIGFEMNDPTHQKGLGLKSMESRVKFIGGTFELNSVPDIGTSVQINISQ